MIWPLRPVVKYQQRILSNFRIRLWVILLEICFVLMSVFTWQPLPLVASIIFRHILHFAAYNRACPLPILQVYMPLPIFGSLYRERTCIVPCVGEIFEVWCSFLLLLFDSGSGDDSSGDGVMVVEMVMKVVMKVVMMVVVVVMLVVSAVMVMMVMMKC